jgi:acetylornithine deacetylase/succinyl-diaminopimelate desuccinylase-like protein
MFANARAYWQSGKDKFLADLMKFLQIPSISANRELDDISVMQAAQFVVKQLNEIGMQNVKLHTASLLEHPLVTADWLHAGSDKPTVLLYAHFDVQPVDPVHLWKSGPFRPEVRDGKLFARGAADDKGQLFILLKALEGFLKTSGKLPVNIKVLFEGEEESGGEHIARYLKANSAALKADAVLVLDSGMYAPGMPTIATGLRGLICAKVNVQGAAGDLHSGEHGGAAPNAAQGLAEILTALKTPTGRVRIPGFYKQVIAPTKLELASWAKLPFDEEQYCRQELGAPALIGDKRYSVARRRWALPTLEVNGIAGGYAGEGFKTVIPASASANVSMRLVPGMDPEKVAADFVAFVKRVTPPHVRSEVEIISQAPAMVVDTANPYIQAAADAFKQIFNAETVYVRVGGSIPIAADFQAVLGAPVLITGFTLPDCNLHAPNENLDLANFYAGIETIGAYFANVGKMRS